MRKIVKTFALGVGLALVLPTTSCGAKNNDNLAIGKIVSATAPSFQNRLNDGDLNKAWSQDPCPAMFEIDLGDTYNISKVKFYGFDDEKNFHHYKVLVSADGRDYSLYGEKNNDKIDSVKGDAVHTDNKMIARYVRFDVTYASNNNVCSVREVEIFGDKTSYTPSIPTVNPLDDKDVAYGKKATSNLNYMKPEAVTSGDTENYFRAEYSPVYIDVDLGAQYKIDEIILTFPETNHYYYYKVYGSNDGNAFTTLYTKGSDNKSLPGQGGDIIKKEMFVDPSTNQYRFIRVYLQYQNKNATASLASIRVHGTYVKDGEPVERNTIEEALDVGPFDPTVYVKPDTIEAVKGIVNRIYGNGKEGWFTFSLDSTYEGDDYFQLGVNGTQIQITGNNGLMLAAGVKYYMEKFIHANVTEQTVQIPTSATIVTDLQGDTGKHINHAKIRYAFNYCTLDYSFAFYNEEEWQRELDYLALNGVNLVLDLAGQEAVWIKFLQNFGYTYDAAKAWLTGPAYYAWQFMSNMDVYGGAVTDGWVKERLDYARRSQQWRLALGMNTCLQGYAGMVPQDFDKYKPEVPVLEQGPWNGFDRPDMIRTDNDYYKDFAKKFYDAQKWAFGTDNHYYATDPFHEGGIRPDDLSDDKISDSVMTSLLESDEDAVWVIQAWHANPSTELLAGIAPYDHNDVQSKRRIEHTLVLDLTGIGIGDLVSKWDSKHYSHETEGDTWLHEEQFDRTPWVLGLLESYGGNPSMDGRLLQMVEDYVRAMNNTYGGRNFFQGIGMLSEGTLDNPVVYNLFYDLPWIDASKVKTHEDCVNWLNNWLDTYLKTRYNYTSESFGDYSFRDGWTTLTYESIYSGCVLRTNPFVLNQMPALVKKKFIEFNLGGLTNSNTELENAFKQVVEWDEEKGEIAATKFQMLADAEGYRYDVVDMMRQIVNNTADYVYLDLMDDFAKHDSVNFLKDKTKFMHLYDLMDEILSCNATWLGGEWIGRAQDWGNDLKNNGDGDFAYDSFVDQAKSIITTWGNKDASDHLEGYAQRTYQGILVDVYKPRWDAYLTDVFNNIVDPTDPYEEQGKGLYFDTFREWMFSDKSNNYLRENDLPSKTELISKILNLASEVINEAFYLTAVE